jgi:hypothetical protein
MPTTRSGLDTSDNERTHPEINPANEERRGMMLTTEPTWENQGSGTGSPPGTEQIELIEFEIPASGITGGNEDRMAFLESMNNIARAMTPERMR